jgi:amidophosphoribosyltransferase
MEEPLDKAGEKCAVFGIYAKGADVSRIAFFGLFALQHRGQESSGIASSNGTKICSHKGMGLVNEIFTKEAIESMQGHIAIGHNRYSTSKNSTVDHAQPILFHQEHICTVAEDTARCVTDDKYSIALAHNGNLPSTALLENFLRENGKDVGDCSDSHMIVKAIEIWIKKGAAIEDAVKNVWPLMSGSFSITLMTHNKLIAIRDKFGIRPLSMGRLGEGYVFASETCALPPIGATFEREVLPGEMIVIDENGMKSFQIEEPDQKLDIFELFYFARHESDMLGRSIYEVRKNFGKILFEEFPVKADVVIPVPETSVPAAIGYSHASGIPYELGLNKNRYVQRTFIQPDQKMRENAVKMKLHPIPDVIAGKSVVVIDDSIVRGTTSKQVVKMLFDAGAKEVHFLVSSPPIRFPDFYGIDIPNQKDLIAFEKTEEEIRQYLGATSLHYLTLDGAIKATGLPKSSFNTSCFTGEYPLDIHERAQEFMHPAPEEVLVEPEKVIG